MQTNLKRVWLIGAPNSGKTSLFNALTNLNLRTGNYSGITTDVFETTLKHADTKLSITDMPGIFSVFSTSEDERVVTSLISQPENLPDVACVISTIDTLSLNLLIYSQLQNLGLSPRLILLREKHETVPYDLNNLIDLEVNHSEKADIDALKTFMISPSKSEQAPLFEEDLTPLFNNYLSDPTQTNLTREVYLNTAKRKHKINTLLKTKSHTSATQKTQKLDKILLNPTFGYLIFFGVLFVLFQLLFVVSDPLMGYIETGFEYLSTLVTGMGQSVFTDLLSQGIIPGFAGVVVFVPQIFFLFFFLSLLEESGYFARAVVLFDKPMSAVGLNGKSVVPIISGFACAIPAIMGARTIDNKHARLNTIFVTPLVSCSARLPVYALIISIIIPKETYFGFLSLEGITLFALYVLGIVLTFVTSLVIHLFKKAKESYVFTLSMPNYRVPTLSMGLKYSIAKTKQFLYGAGKIIFVLSIIVWFLGSHQFSSESIIAKSEMSESMVASIGRTIEPVIEPLGYDWKIGIALVSSFVAREVFAGTIKTLEEIEGTPFMPDFATGISLLIFYTIALQCLSTVGVVISETRSYKFGVGQLLFMNILAYLFSMIVYQLMT